MVIRPNYENPVIQKLPVSSRQTNEPGKSIEILEETPLQGGPVLPAPEHPYFQSDDFRTDLDALRKGLGNVFAGFYDGEEMTQESLSDSVDKLTQNMFSKEGMSENDRNYLGVVVAAAVNLARQVEAAKRERALESQELPDKERTESLNELKKRNEKAIQPMSDWWKELVARFELTPVRTPSWSGNPVSKGFVIDTLT